MVLVFDKCEVMIRAEQKQDQRSAGCERIILAIKLSRVCCRRHFILIVQCPKDCHIAAYKLLYSASGSIILCELAASSIPTSIL